jgi:hypothetical protein
MRRRQFTLKTLLWLTLAVAAFFAGMKLARRGAVIIVENPSQRLSANGP